MLIVGTVIGAGFASGAEIVSFFGRVGISPFNALLCLPLIAGGCILFLSIGSRFKIRDVGALHKLTCGKIARVCDGFVLLNALIVPAGMLAAFDSVSKSLFGFPMLSIPLGILAAVVVAKGIGGVIKVNTVVLPAVIAALIAVCAKSLTPSLFECALFGVKPISAAVYTSMNLVLAAGALTSVHDLKPSETVASSLIATGIIGALMTFVILALNSSGKFYSELPTLEMAKDIHPILYYGMLVSMSVSVFTTLLTAMNCLTDYAQSITKGRVKAAFAVLTVGLLLSALGFERVVGALYPIIGGLGAAYVALHLIFAVRMRIKAKRDAKLSFGSNLLFDKRDSEIHKRGKHAENNRRRHNKV